MEMEKPKRSPVNSKRSIIVIVVGAIVVVVLFVVGLLAFLNTVLSPIVERGDDFLTAVQEDRFEDAYAFLHSSLQTEVSFDNFQESFAPIQIESWFYNQRSVKNGIGLLRGSITIDGQAQNLNLMFVYEADSWQIIAYSFGGN